jgi:hypothetical protein
MRRLKKGNERAEEIWFLLRQRLIEPRKDSRRKIRGRLLAPESNS